MSTVHINVGSNLGDSRALIERAVAGITFCIPGEKVSVSDFYESPAWGFESAHNFVNLGVMITGVTLCAGEVLRRLQEVERSVSGEPHRNADGSYRDRLIDIDLIAIDDMVVNTPDLTLPHPRMHLRLFVLAPMAELDPEWRHPLRGLTAEEMQKRIDHPADPL